MANLACTEDYSEKINFHVLPFLNVAPPDVMLSFTYLVIC